MDVVSDSDIIIHCAIMGSMQPFQGKNLYYGPQPRVARLAFRQGADPGLAYITPLG